MAGEVIEIRPQAGPQEAFLASKADVVVYGGAAFGGKSFALILDPLRFIDNSEFGAVIFRRTSPQIRNEGGLWDESAKLYPLLGASGRDTYLDWTFPSGATVSFSHLQYEKDKYNFQGAQIPAIAFDELTHFSESQFFYLLGRNRSTCGIRPYVRATCNPDADSWVADFIEWYIEQDPKSSNYGYPIRERCGIIRWFTRIRNVIKWADTREELIEKYQVDGEELMPKSFTFIPALASDNKIGLSKDPGYMANLQAQDTVEYERLGKGNWKVRKAKGKFKRSHFQVVEEVPVIAKRARHWDLGGSSAKTADFSVGVLIAYDPQGLAYIEDVVRGQWEELERNTQIRDTAARDRAKYGNVKTSIEEGIGLSKAVTENIIKFCAGYAVKSIRPVGSKENRAEPLLTYCQAGNVRMKKADWNDDYLNVMTSFDPSDESAKGHDDDVDASSGAFTEVTTQHDYVYV
jgi:predicted phage terminase large subunit-like protein